jgi:hypothetical protein
MNLNDNYEWFIPQWIKQISMQIILKEYRILETQNFASPLIYFQIKIKN